MTKEEIKQKSIVNYMETCGYQRQTHSGKWVLFYSPFRNDHKPSFGVNSVLNTWADFGTEDGGDIISLVMKMENISFEEACSFISEGSNIKFVDHERKAEEKSIDIRIVDLKIPSLVQYICGVRKIARPVYEMYCKTVAFSFPSADYFIPMYAIGFQNDKGGWEVRNETYKVASSPKWFTTIGEDTQKVNVFEGFINFLSALTYFGKTSFKNRTFVLNGTGQISNLLPLLEGKHVMYFGDNDIAGNKVLVKMKLNGIQTTDCRGIFEWQGDFNELLTS